MGGCWAFGSLCKELEGFGDGGVCGVLGKAWLAPGWLGIMMCTCVDGFEAGEACLAKSGYGHGRSWTVSAGYGR